MLTQQEIYREAIALPYDEQKELVEKLSQNLKRENGENRNKESDKKELSIEERKAIVERLAGSLKMENPPMTKEETREMYYEHLSEKYK
jgi:type III secretion system FlhB-like substrate exporter